MCKDIEMFFRYMIINNYGSIYVKHDGTGWYVGKKINDQDVWLASYNGQISAADIYAEILREFRENVFIENFVLKRPRYLREALSYLYFEILEDGKKHFPRVIPGGRIRK